MYITCGEEANGISVEPETGYVPNNPLFGLPPLDASPPHQDCISSCSGCNNCQSASLTGSDFIDCGNCLDHNLLSTASSQFNQQPSVFSNSYWTEDNMMSSFPGLPPLELDSSLPSLFPFSPCNVSYNRDRPPHDMADVLLSLKHAVLKPSPEPLHHHQPTSHGYGTAVSTPQQTASLTYTVHPHPHQMLVSPNHHPHHHHHYQGHHSHPQNHAHHHAQNSGGFYENSSCSSYPSMSVNVSMNMTMHGYGSETAIQQCSQGDNFQMQWSPQSSSSQMNILYPPLVSPSHYAGGATYSITADFRPPVSSSSSSGQPSLNYCQSQAMEPALPKSISPDSLSMSQQKSLYYPSNSSQTNSNLSSFLPQKSPHFTIQPNPLPNPSSNSTNCHQMSPIGKLDGEEEEGELSGEDSLLDSKPNLCRLCGKTYARPSTLKTHLRTHSGERPYRCPDCNKSFSQAANLTAHVRTHTGQKPFRCPICDRRFSQSSSVTTHMRTHSGERPYRCRACKKAFSDSSTLTKHLRIHSGEKPYQCKMCLLRFSQSGNLNRHMRVHGTTAGLST